MLYRSEDFFDMLWGGSFVVPGEDLLERASVLMGEQVCLSHMRTQNGNRNDSLKFIHPSNMCVSLVKHVCVSRERCVSLS